MKNPIMESSAKEIPAPMTPIRIAKGTSGKMAGVVVKSPSARSFVSVGRRSLPSRAASSSWSGRSRIHVLLLGVTDFGVEKTRSVFVQPWFTRWAASRPAATPTQACVRSPASPIASRTRVGRKEEIGFCAVTWMAAGAIHRDTMLSYPE